MCQDDLHAEYLRAESRVKELLEERRTQFPVLKDLEDAEKRVQDLKKAEKSTVQVSYKF